MVIYNNEHFSSGLFILAEVGSEFCRILNQCSKYCQTFTILPKWQNVAKYGHTGCDPKKYFPLKEVVVVVIFFLTARETTFGRKKKTFRQLFSCQNFFRLWLKPRYFVSWVYTSLDGGANNFHRMFERQKLVRILFDFLYQFFFQETVNQQLYR